MANQLKMAEIQSILTLRTRGWSFRRIARELGVHRETVARYYKKLEFEARKRLKTAVAYEKKKAFDRADEIYREVSRSFSRMEKVKARAEAGLKRVSLKREMEKEEA